MESMGWTIEELLAMVEVVGRRIFLVAGCDSRETITHTSDLVHETSLLKFWIVTIMNAF
jgi:hypothetical protein